MAKKFEIRNSTAEFLIFQIEGKEDGVQVVYRDETIWCTQKAMAQLFDCSTDNIGQHLKNIFESGELTAEATTENFSVVEFLSNSKSSVNSTVSPSILARIYPSFNTLSSIFTCSPFLPRITGVITNILVPSSYPRIWSTISSTLCFFILFPQFGQCGTPTLAYNNLK